MINWDILFTLFFFYSFFFVLLFFFWSQTCMGVYLTIKLLLYRGVAATFIGEGNRSAQRKPAASHLLYHMLHRIHLSWVGFELTALVVTGSDCIDSCNSNYTTITTTMAPTRIVYIEHIMVLAVICLIKLESKLR